MNNKLKNELISKFTIEGKGKNLACAVLPQELIEWIDANFIPTETGKSCCGNCKPLPKLLDQVDNKEEKYNSFPPQDTSADIIAGGIFDYE